MPKVLLIAQDSAYPQMGVLYLADALNKSGIESKILPSTITNLELNRFLRSYQPSIIGMSVITSPQLVNFIRLSVHIKECFPFISIIWGGNHPTLLPELCLNQHYIDHIVTGQGEIVFPKMVHRIMAGKQVPRYVVGYTPTKLDDFAPAWQEHDLAQYIFSESHYPGKCFYYFLTSRGCPYKCTFCSEALKIMHCDHKGKFSWNAHGFDWFQDQVERVIERLSQKQITLDGIGIWDDMFWVDYYQRPRARHYLKFLHDKHLGYLIEARADQLIRNNASLMRTLAKTGCIQVFIGAESISQDTLNLIRKGTKSSDYKKLITLANNYQVSLRMSFIVGFPEETDQSVNATLDFCEAVKGNEFGPWVSISGPKIFTPYPGTVEFTRALKAGFQQPATMEAWGMINRSSDEYLRHFPWIKRNYSTRTLRRLERYFGQGDNCAIGTHTELATARESSIHTGERSLVAL